MNKLKLAVIGCGMIAEHVHLPVLIQSEQVEVTVLIDKLLPRAQKIAKKFNIPKFVEDYQNVVDDIDAALVATPHNLHAPVTIGLLKNGIHVLVEKPMALKTKDCDEMIKAANNSGAVLAVGMVCRFYEVSKYIKQIIDNDFLGNIMRFDLRQGDIYNWSPVDCSMFHRETGGGVLTGVGVHGLDRLLWIFGDFSSVEYFDDARGGVEADCEMELTFKNNISGFVEFSRTRNLRNTFIIEGEKGTLEFGTGSNPLVKLIIGKSQEFILSGQIKKNKNLNDNHHNPYYFQFTDFINAIINNRKPLVSGVEGKRVVNLLDACLAKKQPLKRPWIV